MLSNKILLILSILLFNFCIGYENQVNSLYSSNERITVALERDVYKSSQNPPLSISAYFSKPVVLNYEKLLVVNGNVKEIKQITPQQVKIDIESNNPYAYSKISLLEGFGVTNEKYQSQVNNILIEPLKRDNKLLSSGLNVTMMVDKTASTKQLPYLVVLTFNPPLLDDFTENDLTLNNIIVVTKVCEINKTQCKLYVIPHEGNSNINTVTLNANSLVSIYNTTNTEGITIGITFNKNSVTKYILYQKLNGKFDMFSDIWENNKDDKVFNAIFEVPCIDTKYFGLLQDPIHTTNYYYIKASQSGLYLNKYVNGKDISLKSMGLRCQVDRVPFWVSVDRGDSSVIKISFGNSNIIGKSRLIYYEDNDLTIGNTKYLTFANTNITTIISSIKVNCPYNGDKECSNHGKCSKSLQCECGLFHTGIACESIDFVEVFIPVISVLFVVLAVVGLYFTRDKWMYLITGEDNEEKLTETGNELSLIEHEV